MFVSRSMAKKVTTVDKETGILDAQSLMQRQEIRHLPVVDEDNHLVGMITDLPGRRQNRGVTPPGERPDGRDGEARPP